MSAEKEQNPEGCAFARCQLRNGRANGCADAGRARLLGGDPRSPAVRRHIGATPQETGLPPNLRVREVIELVRAHYEAPVATNEETRREMPADDFIPIGAH